MMTLEQLGFLHRAQLEAWLAVTEEAVEGVNRVIGLNLQALKAGFGETGQCLHEAAGAQDAGQWFSAHVKYLQPAGERVSGYTRNLVEIGVQTQNGIAKVLQRHGDEVRRHWGAVTENLVDAAPPGSEAVVNLMKAAVGWEVAAAEAVEELVVEEGGGQGTEVC
ncbi:phasin family protein [Ralstonia solanacearum]|uniref:phasin family protein n=1 Tax=Ralstonia solanacearum TaxID=305 RepID=UPI0001D93A2D|nr:phasin family protein [Ralstonia solanacearum]AST32479.2 phasin family protein [Ralstonia solanacearum]MDB0507616.1 phasin family protein [Ralstonia solanacearum]MDB0512723.1 phasin family protein [Ralstonia solanacearum]CBJ42711.1 putative polyhydroxybutyrate granule-associated protein, Phasin (phaP) [Ralstonia solanacearum CFBP2957]